MNGTELRTMHKPAMWVKQMLVDRLRGGMNTEGLVPERVVLRERLVCTFRESIKSKVHIKGILIRNDGWTLGFTPKACVAAYKLWTDRWIGYIHLSEPAIIPCLGLLMPAQLFEVIFHLDTGSPRFIDGLDFRPADISLKNYRDTRRAACDVSEHKDVADLRFDADPDWKPEWMST